MKKSIALQKSGLGFLRSFTFLQRGVIVGFDAEWKPQMCQAGLAQRYGEYFGIFVNYTRSRNGNQCI